MTDSPATSRATVIEPVTLRSVTLGTGRTKVCVPLVQPDAAHLREAVAELPSDVVDLVELRLDHLVGVDRADGPHLDGPHPDGPAGRPAARTSSAVVLDALAVVRASLDEAVPVLATFRSAREGGERELSPEAYERLLVRVVDSGLVDAVDVEMFTAPDVLARVVAHAHAHGVPVVMSSHDFHGTPSHDEIVSRLRTQQEQGADVVKVAVMPRSARDVLTLLDATEDFRTNHATRPAVTMAMGGLGAVSRLVGEPFGSCLSFGAVGAASAPGQVAAPELRSVIDLVHAAATAGSPTSR